MKGKLIGAATGAVALSGLLSGPAQAVGCQTGDFQGWLASFKREAIGKGVSRRTADAALRGIRYNPKVVKLDRRQSVFAQTFLKFSGRMVSAYRLRQGRRLLKKYARTFARVRKTYGVPGPVITAFWGLETDYGAFMGNMSTLRSLATLAYDCRRSALFQRELLSALKIIDRGDLTPAKMIGPWAGELGQTQFLPSHYYNHAVDFDGDGRRDLIKSKPDVIASSANLLRFLGWRRGEPWLEEVRVPARLPWDQADIAIKHPRAKWARWGVRRANGRPLPSDSLAATLLLPMGRRGPAFLAYRNFDIYLQWNKSLVYSTTAAYFATRLNGARRVGGGGDVDSLSFAQIKQLQRLLERRGFDVGKVDGIIGARTRSAVKAVQIKYGLPADSYPTSSLLARLRG